MSDRLQAATDGARTARADRRACNAALAANLAALPEGTYELGVLNRKWGPPLAGSSFTPLNAPEQEDKAGAGSGSTLWAPIISVNMDQRIQG